MYPENEFIQVAKIYLCVTYIQTSATVAFFINKHFPSLILAIKRDNSFTVHIDTFVNYRLKSFLNFLIVETGM